MGGTSSVPTSDGNPSGLDDFLSGTFDSGSSGSTDGDGTRYSYQNGAGAYLLDSWRLTPKVTVNYGIRWDYYGVVGAQNNAFSNFDVKTGALETVGAPGGPSSLYPKDWTNFAPRLSVANDLLGNGKLVVRVGTGIFYDGPSQDFFVGNQPWNTLPAEAGPAFNGIGFASPVVSTISSGVAIFGNYTPNSVFTVDQKLVTPRYGSYNLNLESQLAKKIAVQIGYVGSQGRHLFHFRDLNQFNNVPGRTVSCGNGKTIGYGEQCFSTYSVGSFVDTPLYYINQIETSSESNYNSLQSTLKLQNFHNLTSTLNYTWSHSIDTASDGLDFVPNAAQPDDSFNPHAERANSNFDVRQRLQWYWTYKAPAAKSVKFVGSGWAMDGMFNFASGQPYTVSYLYEGDFNGSGEFFGRMDIVGDPHAGAHGTNLLNLAAFAVPNGRPGNEGRNAFNSPNYKNFDFSLTKTSHLSEKVTMELRTDFFNLFNHPNLSNPLLPGFGIDALATSGQFITTTATPDVGSGNPYLGGGGPRSIQAAAHFSF